MNTKDNGRFREEDDAEGLTIDPMYRVDQLKLESLQDWSELRLTEIKTHCTAKLAAHQTVRITSGHAALNAEESARADLLKRQRDRYEY